LDFRMLPAMACGSAMQNCRRPGQCPKHRRAAMAGGTPRENQCHPRKLFIGGLAHKTTTQHLRDYFSRYGSIIDVVVLRWPDGRSRGFGYVTFSEMATVTAALSVPHQLGGRQIDVKRAVPGTNKVFVGGLPQSTDAAELRDYFEAFGTVSDAVVMIDTVTGRSRGFGFVCYLPGPEGAAAVVAALGQYKKHRIRGKWIEVKSAASPHKLAAKEERDGLHDGSASASASTAAGTCDESQSADSEPESASAKGGLDEHCRPEASPHGHKLVPSNLRQFCDQSPPHVEPCNVSLFGTTATFATLGTPPGLDVPWATDAVSGFQDDVGLVPHQAPWPHTKPGMTPWPVGCPLAMSIYQHAFSAEPASAQPAAQQCSPNLDPSEWGSPPFEDGSSLFSARHSLQKSLEQLLKQQSVCAAGEKSGAGSTEISA